MIKSRARPGIEKSHRRANVGRRVVGALVAPDVTPPNGVPAATIGVYSILVVVRITVNHHTGTDKNYYYHSQDTVRTVRQRLYVVRSRQSITVCDKVQI